MYSTRKKSQGASSSRRLSFSKLKPAGTGNTKGIGVASLQKNNKMLAKALQEAQSELNIYRKTLNESSKCMSQFKFAKSKMLQMNSVLKSFVQGFEEVLLILNFDDSGLFQAKPPVQAYRTFKDQMDKIADLTVTSEEPSFVEVVDPEPVVETCKSDNVIKLAISNEESAEGICSKVEHVCSSSKCFTPANEIPKDVEEANTDEKSPQTSSPRKTSEVDAIKPFGSSQPKIGTNITEKTPASGILHKSQIPKITKIPICRVTKNKSNSLKFSAKKKLSNQGKCTKKILENTGSDLSYKKTLGVKDSSSLANFSDNQNEKFPYPVDSLNDNECFIGEEILRNRKTFVKFPDGSKNIAESRNDTEETIISHHRKTFVKVDVPKDAPQLKNETEETVMPHHKKTVVKVQDGSKKDAKETIISHHRKTFVKVDVPKDAPQSENETEETVMPHHEKTVVKVPDGSKNDAEETIISHHRKTFVKVDVPKDAPQSKNDTEETIISHHKKTVAKVPDGSKNDAEETIISHHRKPFVKVDVPKDAPQSKNDTEETIISHHKKTVAKVPDGSKNDAEETIISHHRKPFVKVDVPKDAPRSKNDTEETVMSHHKKTFVEVPGVSKDVSQSNSNPEKNVMESSNKSKSEKNVKLTSANADQLTAAVITEKFNKSFTIDSTGTVEAQKDAQITNSAQLTAAVLIKDFGKNLTIDSDTTGTVEAQRGLQGMINPDINIQSPSKRSSSAINSKIDVFCINQKVVPPDINKQCFVTQMPEVAQCSDDILIDFCNKKQKVQAGSTNELKTKKKKGKKDKFPVSKNAENFRSGENIAVDVLHLMKTAHSHDSATQDEMLQKEEDCEEITHEKGKRGQKRKTKKAKEKTAAEHSENVISSASNNCNSKFNEKKTQKKKVKKCISKDNQDSPCQVTGKNSFTVQAEIHQPPSHISFSDLETEDQENEVKDKKPKNEGNEKFFQNEITKDIENANKENKQLEGAQDLQVYVVLKDFRKTHHIDESEIPTVEELTSIHLPVRTPLSDNSSNISQLPDKISENVMSSEENGTNEITLGKRRRNRKPVSYLEPTLNRKMRR